jgi:sulfonate transport system permease protein
MGAKLNNLPSYRGLLAFLALLVIWQGASWLQLFKNGLFPSPLLVSQTLLELLQQGTLSQELLRSCQREAAGFLLGVSGGFLLGTAMGLSRIVEKLIGPLYHAMRQVPLLGWIPLIILWFGIADTSKIVFISIGAFYPMVLNTFEGIRSVPHSYIEVARVFEYGRLGMLRRFILPAALPNIMTGVRMSLGFSWMLVVGAEIFTRTDGGIGDLMWSGREQFRMDIVIVGVITIGLVGFLINEGVRLLEVRLFRWRATYR